MPRRAHVKTLQWDWASAFTSLFGARQLNRCSYTNQISFTLIVLQCFSTPIVLHTWMIKLQIYISGFFLLDEPFLKSVVKKYNRTIIDCLLVLLIKFSAIIYEPVNHSKWSAFMLIHNFFGWKYYYYCYFYTTIKDSKRSHI